MEIPAQTPMRFIFPHAPVRSITINGGMHGWYDITGVDFEREQDRDGIEYFGESGQWGSLRKPWGHSTRSGPGFQIRRSLDQPLLRKKENKMALHEQRLILNEEARVGMLSSYYTNMMQSICSLMNR